MLDAPAGTPAAQFCLVYNYFAGAATPTTCLVPSQAGSNNGSIMGYFYKDSRSTDLRHEDDFTYDSLNRLTSSIATPVAPGTVSHNLDFAYDRWGNADCVADGQTQGPCANWSFDTSKNQINGSGFSHDAAGNTTADGSCSYTWDGEGRMTAVSDCATASYTYNALGQRVEKNAGGAYTEIAYDLGGVPVGYHNRTAWTSQYVPLGGRMLAVYQNGYTYFLHPNALGSTTMVYNHTGGTVKQDTIYYHFGQTWDSRGTAYDERFASRRAPPLAPRSRRRAS